MKLPSTLIPGGPKWLPLLFGLLGYSTLNRGFAYIGIYPFFWAELCLLIFLFSVRHSRTFPQFVSTNAGKIWLIFFVYSAVIFINSAVLDFSESLRNSVLWVYTLYFYVGFVYGGVLIRKGHLERFSNFLKACAVLVVFYYGLFPFRENLLAVTSFLQGGGVSLIGYYSTLHALALGFVFIFICGSTMRFRLVFFTFGMFFIVVIAQSRAAMLALFFMIFYAIFFIKTKTIKRDLAYIAFIALLIGGAFISFGINIEGQRGAVSADFFQNAIASIFFGSDIDSLEGSRADRLLWWYDILGRVFASFNTTAFGIGFNEILVDRATGENTILRYPHNSFVSVLGFLGVVGLILYCSIVIIAILKVMKSSKYQSGTKLMQWYPLFAIGYFVSAFFSTVFEAPFHSFVFWTLSGICYRVACLENNQ